METLSSDDLRHRLAERAAALGIEVPSQRRISYWVEADLIPGAVGVGRGYARGKEQRYTEESVRRAEKLLRLKARRISRVSSLIVCLFLEGENFSEETLKSAIGREIKYWVNRLWRGKTTPTENWRTNSDDENLTKKWADKLGPLDTAFEIAGLKLPAGDLVLLAYGAFCETDSSPKSAEILRTVIARIFSGAPQLPSAAPALDGLLAYNGQTVGDDLGNRGISIIQEAKMSDLGDARAFRNFLIAAFSDPQPYFSIIGFKPPQALIDAFRRAGKSIESDLWGITIFPLFVWCMKWSRENSPGGQLPTLPEIQNFVKTMSGPNAADIGRPGPGI